MVKNIKYILTRILIGVGVVIALQLLQGTLIGNVYAEVYSYGNSDGSNISSCTNCASLTYNWNFDTHLNSYGYLYFNVLTFGEMGGLGFLPTITNSRVKINNLWYSCEVTNSAQINDYNNIHSITNRSSLKCPVSFKDSSVLQTIYIGTVSTGQDGISIYSPVTYVEDNSSSIIDQIEESTNQQIESQMTCKKYDKESVKLSNTFLSSGGTAVSNSNFGVSSYIRIDVNSKIKVLVTQNSQASTCFYNSSKTLISCIKNNTLLVNDILTIPNNSSYVRFSFNTSANEPQFQICKNGNQGVVDSNEQLNDTLSYFLQVI